MRTDLEEYGRKLNAIAQLLEAAPTINEVAAVLGNDIRAHTAVPAAIYAFLSHPRSFADAVTYAVQLGGDRDTIGAMTGAIAGARHGVTAIPRGWLDALDNTGKGGNTRLIWPSACTQFTYKPSGEPPFTTPKPII